jgi:hypothetical protein
VGFLQAKRGVNTTANQAVNELLDMYDTVKGQFEVDNPGILEQTFEIATPEQIEAHDKRFIHQYTDGNFDVQKAQEYIFGKSENQAE